KDSEFRVWLIEEKQLNPETISKDRQRKEFSIFVEDYNTATLPHEKYYNMTEYEVRMKLIRSGQTLTLEADKYDPMKDEKEHENMMKARYGPRESDLTREEILELRKIQKERSEIGKMRILGMSVPKEMGVRTKEVDRNVLFPPDPY
ncbi:hypothetical protein TREMEDRAFT_29770, partial [Tremella mesenterica DSM 1558]|uniref:uncharacterized protein n=1 Tax=Tremella mesenterica (strain ATCC 24925 / CBS 8224 / DSM 1558 / NBRC 9311 / NRRL Y-6157 / RJB 2259-6 / UBC 559-6) TaxID=578456 RepID=UPI0003F49D49